MLRADQSLGFIKLPFDTDFSRFAALAAALLDAAKAAAPAAELTASDDQALIHITTIPWLSFTSFTHPRALDGKDSVPKLAFARFMQEGGQTWMPVAVEVHHGLTDGLHVDRFHAEMQGALTATA